MDEAEWLLRLASAALFAAAVCTVLGVGGLATIRTRTRAAARRRVRAMAGAEGRRPAVSPDLRKPGGRGRRWSAWTIGGLVAQAGFGRAEWRALMAATGVGTALAAAALIAVGQRMSGVPGGLLLLLLLLVLFLGLAVPVALLRHRAARRRQQFVAQLPTALDIMKRALRAGQPIHGALAMVGREMPAPLGAEFAATANEVAYGLDLREALSHLGRRMAVPELRYFTIAINVQHETGGNLAVILDRLAHLIRARFRLAKKVRVLSAEARLSARLLALMPPIFAGLIFLARPEVYLEIADDPLVVPVVLAAAALQVVGMLVMRWLVRFEV